MNAKSIFLSALLIATGCGQPDTESVPEPAPVPPSPASPESADFGLSALDWAATGAVYAMTNQAGKNEIVVYKRGEDGKLTLSTTVPTGGGGSGEQLDPADPLGSQGALLLHRRMRLVFAVNTESSSAHSEHDCKQGTISIFRLSADGHLTLIGAPVPSGGLFPNSLTAHGDRLYVLNAGGPDQCSGGSGFDVNPNITGFTISTDGKLNRIPEGSQRINPGTGSGPDKCAPGNFGPLSDCGLSPPHAARSAAQVAFTPYGDALVVEVKGTNSIYVFPVDWRNGTPGAPKIWRAPGPTLPTYFGEGFDRHGNLLVVEPLGTATSIPAPDASALSSFKIESDGTLRPISSDVPSGLTEACWFAMEPYTLRHVYVSNTHGDTISIYDVDSDGKLTYLSGATQRLTSSALPTEIVAVAAGRSRYLYALLAGKGKVATYRIQDDGTLSPLGEVEGLPASAVQGLAAF